MGHGYLCRLAICLALALVAHALPPNPAFQALTEIATPHVTAERAAAEKAEAERAAAERAAEKAAAEKAAAEKAQPASLTIPASGTAVRRKDGRTPWYLNTPATVATPTTTQPTAPAMTETIRTEIKRPVDPTESASWELADPEGCDARADAGECIASSTNSAAKSALMRKECQAACWKSWKDHAAEREAANKEKAVAEKAAAEQAVAEKATAEKTVAEKAAAEKAVAEKAAAEKAAREKAAVTFQMAVAEKAATASAAEKAAAEQAAAVEEEFQKALAEKVAAEKAAAEKATAEKAAAEKAAAEQAAAVEAAFQRALAEQAAIEAAAAEKAAAAAEKAAMEKAAAEEAAAGMAAAVEAEFQKALAEKAAAEKAAAKEAAYQKAAAVRKEAAEQAALARKAEAERAAAARKAEAEQAAAARKTALEKADAEMNAAAQKEYAERAAAEKAAFEIGIAQRAALTEFLVPADEPPNCAHRALQGECALECLSQWCARTQCKVTCERSDVATRVAAQNAAAQQAYEENAAAEKATLAAILAPEPADCPQWAAAGECEANPDFMLTECHMACELAIEAEKAAAKEAAAEEAASEAEAAAEEAAAAAEAAAAKAYAEAEAAAEKEAAEKAAKEKAAAKEEAAKEAAEEAAAEKAGSSFAQVLVIISDHESGATEFGHALNTHPCVFDLGEPFSYTSMVWSTTEHVTGCNMSSFADAIFDSGTGTLRRRSNPVLNQKILALSSSKKPAMRPTNLTGDASSLYLGLKYDFADYFVRVRDLVCEGVPKDVCPPANCTITLNFFPQFVNANTAGQLVKERPPTKCMLARNEATMVAWEDALRSIAKNPKVAMMSLLRNEADRQFASFRQYSPAGTEFDCSLPRPPTSFATVSNSYTDGQLAIESCWAGASAADKCLGDALRPVGLRIEPMGGAGTTIMLASSGLSPTSPTCPCDGDGPILTNPGDDELIVTNKTELARSATVLRQSDQKRLVRAAARDVSAMTCRCEDDEPSHTQPEFAWNSTDLHNHPASGQAANLRMPRSASCSEPNTIFKRLANGELDQRAADDGATSTRMPPVAAAPVAAAPVAAAPVAAAPANDALVERAVNEPHQPNRDQQLQPPTAAAIDTKAAKKAEKEAAEAAKKAEKEAAEAKKKADKEAAEVAPAPVAPAPVAPAPVAAAPVDAAPVTAAPVAAAPVAEQRAPVTAPDASAPVAAPPAKRAQTREQEQQRTRLASKAAAAVKAAKAWQVVAEKAAVEAKAAAEAQAAKAKAATEKAAAAKKDAAEKLAAVQVTEKAAAEKAVVENGNTEFEEPTWRSTADFHITASIPEAGPPWRQPASIPEAGPPWRQPASILEAGPPWRLTASR